MVIVHEDDKVIKYGMLCNSAVSFYLKSLYLKD